MASRREGFEFEGDDTYSNALCVPREECEALCDSLEECGGIDLVSLQKPP